MNKPIAGTSLLVASFFSVGIASDARAQAWSVDLFAGRTTYDAVSANVGANNLAAGIRFDTPSDDWVYGAAAAPLIAGDPFWSALGAGGRFELPGAENRRASLGLEAGAHAFLFRDAVIEQAGNGATLEAIPFASLSAGAARVELRGGWRGHALSYAGTKQNRGVFETGARVGYETSAIRMQADTRWVRASEGTFPFIGGSVLYGGSPMQLWVQAGKWVSEELDEVTWGTGANVTLRTMSSLWAAVRKEGPDPLYWNAPRWAWSVGITHRLGRAPARILPMPRSNGGSIVIRLPRADAPAGTVSIAGDFNNWRPVRMQREGDEWVLRLPLTAGVYKYAFQSEAGKWFVPESVAGRRDDGMGGHVAVMVVS